MNKKGFTLVEMLAVLLVLGILLFMIVPNINSITRKSKQQLYDIQIKSLKESVNIFITDYIKDLSIENEESITMELKLLKDMDIINQDFENPKTGQYFADDMLLTLTNNNDTFTITVNPKDSTRYSETVKYKNHIVLFKGTAISDNSNNDLKENFIVMDYEGRVYDSSEYSVVIVDLSTIDTTYSEIKYQINIIDDEDVTSYTLSRQENCQTGICEQ